MTYTFEEMKPVFDYFADVSDWKNPINKSISFAMMCSKGWSRGLINRSIEHFTATTPTWSPIRTNGYFDVEWNIKSIGYRMSPAGCH
ncbi:MAG: hypothetical protein H8D94_01790 [Candidatus Pelagibacter sp.]|nr:hypothetical protein [Candidatus Pelagibacter sp.]